MIGVAIDYLVMTNFFNDGEKLWPIPCAYNRFYCDGIHNGSRTSERKARERAIPFEGMVSQTNRLREVHFANAASINLV